MHDVLIGGLLPLECLKDDDCFVLILDPAINASILLFYILDDFLLW
jgi:hypothetical protein